MLTCHTLTLVCLYAAAGVGVSLVTGQLGRVSLTHGLFFAVGAYGYAILTVAAGLAPMLALVIAAASSVVAGSLVSILTARLDEAHATFATFAFALLTYDALNNFDRLTRGAAGIVAIPDLYADSPIDGDWAHLATAALFLAACMSAGIWLSSRRIGILWAAFRSDYAWARSLGASASAGARFTWCVSAAMVGVSGALFASFLSVVDPGTFGAKLSVLLLAIPAIAGELRIAFVWFGSALLVGGPDLLRFAGLPAGYVGNLREILLGLALMIAVRLQHSRCPAREE